MPYGILALRDLQRLADSVTLALSAVNTLPGLEIALRHVHRDTLALSTGRENAAKNPATAAATMAAAAAATTAAVAAAAAAAAVNGPAAAAAAAAATPLLVPFEVRYPCMCYLLGVGFNVWSAAASIGRASEVAFTCCSSWACR